MSAPKNPTPDRRDFLAHVATAAAVMAGTACAAPLAAASLSAGSGLRAAPFDDSWTRRVAAAKHKAVFDSPGVDDGLALLHATFFMQGYKEQLGVGDTDVVPVIVLRHAGTALAFNDAIWEKYGFGERAAVKDAATGKFSLSNPFVRIATDAKDPLVPPEASIERLLASGAVILACNKAAMRQAGIQAKKLNRDAEEVRAEFRAGVVPGVLLQPSGIYATLRAQDVGCSFIKST